ncbi:MAG: YebC/PmpR family DNA-binding transcriptional regulator, partial [Pseudomonadales bacterium]|nr:YebC/PmpR family DNA-binding transcriptional regulator [Pseudomonadales bacterium]
TDGSVAYLFDRKGQFNFEPGIDEDALMEVAIEAGADDVETGEDGSVEVLTAPEDFNRVKDALEAGGFEAGNAEIAMIPQTWTELDQEAAEKVMRLIDALEDLDDVQNVYTNASFPEMAEE